MRTVSLSGSVRSNVGKKDARKTRNEGFVPCVVYGGAEQIHFSVAEPQFKDLLFNPNVAFVDLNIDGKQIKAILQDVQYHPVSDAIFHVDFKELSDDKKIIMGIPVKVVGKSIGVTKGGKAQIKSRKIKVKALPANMPEQITLDITHLDVGQSLRIKEIATNNYELLDAPNTVAVTINVTRAAAAAAAAAAASSAPAKGKK